MKALLLWYWKVSSPLSQRNPLKRIRSSSLNDSISLDQDSRFSVRPAPYPVFAEEARINRAWASSSSSIEHLIPEFTFQFPGTRHYFESLELSYPFVLIKELSHCCCCWLLLGHYHLKHAQRMMCAAENKQRHNLRESLKMYNPRIIFRPPTPNDHPPRPPASPSGHQRLLLSLLCCCSSTVPSPSLFVPFNCPRRRRCRLWNIHLG